MADETKPQAPSTEVGKQDIDQILNELDPEFTKKLGELNAEIGQLAVTNLESISISADYFPSGNEAMGDVPLGEEKGDEDKSYQSTVMLLSRFFTYTALLPFVILLKLVSASFELTRNPPLEVVKGLPKQLLPVIKRWLAPLGHILAKIKRIPGTTYLKILMIFVLATGIHWIIRDMQGHLNPDGLKDPFLKGWQDVADATYDIEATEDEGSESSSRNPEYTVLIHRIIANLKARTPKTTPMVSTELYLEASNQDCAIEVHERELEVRDGLERVFEETTFDEFDTREGKEHVKIRIRENLNHFLTKGHIKRVFFSTLNIAP